VCVQTNSYAKLEAAGGLELVEIDTESLPPARLGRAGASVSLAQFERANHMDDYPLNRREVLRGAAMAALPAVAAAQSPASLVIDPQPEFAISPWLYMQFMEPLGVTDSSVEACWDYDRDDWRKDFVDAVKDLSPGAMRFGGLFSRHYKWREGVGPVAKRPTIRNYFWGGKETNRVGTHEFVDLCRRVGAEPFYCVNFRSDGEMRFLTTAEGNRTGDAREAADWVSYANDPDNKERKQNGAAEPFNLRTSPSPQRSISPRPCASATHRSNSSDGATTEGATFHGRANC
jgi:hypothetical protein